MDSKSLERFNFILSKPTNSLSEDEISFLKARRDALNAMQREFYAEVLGESVVAPVAEESSEPKKTTRKKVTK
jgi:hypothetical protein